MFANWRATSYYYADSECTGQTYIFVQEVGIKVAEIYYYSDGQPESPKPTGIYQWNATNNTCVSLGEAFVTNFNWSAFKPMPADVVNLLAKAPYTMELVYE